MEDQGTLICLPDISGFTRFMSEIDLELSSKVIPALLNNIIYSNEIGLKVSEIEGDAVLFYRSGSLPTLKSLIDQSKHFYTQFYHRMETLLVKFDHHEESKRIPKMLGLKIIMHYGKDVSLVPIGKRIKLIGEDVITAHRLLKNSIQIDEYLLLSEKLLSDYNEEGIEERLSWDQLKKGSDRYDHLGNVDYRYIDLTNLITPSSEN
ncbi:DUF2652 domain-containing protein [Sungkyunkwania multivorans]|uniref:DUF2652 domain-containing protein n=1 Tax=Sungkyunkwania multivorans TaxID=1173618 RepID=A0ABW3CS60_9FLAO